MHFLRSVVTGAATIAAVALIPVAAGAQSLAEPNTITVTPFLSATFGTSQAGGNTVGIGGAVGYDLTRNLGFEFEVGRGFDIAGDDANLDWSLTTISVNAIWHFDLPGRVTPYGTFGLGWERSNLDFDTPDPLALTIPSSTEFAWNIGGGVKTEINNRFVARGDLRRFQANDFAPDHWRVYGGLTFWIKR